MKGFGTVVTGTLVSGRIASTTSWWWCRATGGEGARSAGARRSGRPRPSPASASAVNLGGVERRARSAAARRCVAPGAFERDARRRRRRRSAAGARAAQARRARAVPSGHRRDPGPRRGRSGRVGARIAQSGDRRRRSRVRAAAPRSAGRADARRSLHPARVFAADDDCRRPDPRSAAAANGDPQPRPRSSAAGASTFDPAVDDGADAELRAALVMIEDAGPAGLPLAALMSRAGVDPASVERRVRTRSSARPGGPRRRRARVRRRVFAQLKDAIVRTLTEHHRAQPLSEGVPREEAARAAVRRAGTRAVFEARARRPCAPPARSAAGIAWRWPRTAWRCRRKRSARAPSIERAFRDGGLKPPDAAAIAADDRCGAGRGRSDAEAAAAAEGAGAGGRPAVPRRSAEAA